MIGTIIDSIMKKKEKPISNVGPSCEHPCDALNKLPGSYSCRECNKFNPCGTRVLFYDIRISGFSYDPEKSFHSNNRYEIK